MRVHSTLSLIGLLAGCGGQAPQPVPPPPAPASLAVPAEAHAPPPTVQHEAPAPPRESFEAEPRQERPNREEFEAVPKADPNAPAPSTERARAMANLLGVPALPPVLAQPAGGELVYGSDLGS
jgi:hypothetical protein